MSFWQRCTDTSMPLARRVDGRSVCWLGCEGRSWDGWKAAGLGHRDSAIAAVMLIQEGSSANDTATTPGTGDTSSKYREREVRRDEIRADGRGMLRSVALLDTALQTRAGPCEYATLCCVIIYRLSSQLLSDR
jgi:hypothetical protein